MNKIACALCAISVATVGASLESFHACIARKAASCDAPCGGQHLQCTSACVGCAEDLVPKYDGSCCVELPERVDCEAGVKKFAAAIVPRLRQLCPNTHGEFAEAMFGALPFAFQKTETLSSAVEQPTQARFGQLAIGVFAAGAAGSAIALVAGKIGFGKRTQSQ
eukprot:TRINITY_DN779_c0_g1_i1.p1 TRINITY_DN779_c0_g1~~TRINITY_DN779_c0_g1_i1.p1  ORF type:complete len:164 (-),score=30.33 TRINITY_DN779_c0_g1_i1:83-574(-)